MCTFKVIVWRQKLLACSLARQVSSMKSESSDQGGVRIHSINRSEAIGVSESFSYFADVSTGISFQR